MPFTPKAWADRPPELDPSVGETPAQWLARITAYDAANPGVLTPNDAAALIDGETRLSDYTDSAVAAEATARDTAIGVETTARIAAVSSEASARSTADALKAPLASPAFTGNPTAPTPTVGDNDTSLATTAFVTAAVAAGGGGGGGAVDSWHNVTPHANWYASDVQYRKDAEGIVHLRGSISGGQTTNFSNGDIMFTLPAGYRLPASRHAAWGGAWVNAPNGDYNVVVDTYDDGTVCIGRGLNGFDPYAVGNMGTIVFLDGLNLST